MRPQTTLFLSCIFHPVEKYIFPGPETPTVVPLVQPCFL